MISTTVRLNTRLPNLCVVARLQMFPEILILKLEHELESLKGWLVHAVLDHLLRVSDPVSLQWSLRACISGKFFDAAAAALGW